jgi:serine protease Do
MSFINKIRQQKYLSFTVVLFTLSIGILIGTVFNTTVKAAKEQNVAPGATPLVIPSPVVLQNTFATLAKQLEPSVVNISTEYIPAKDTAKKAPKTRRQVPNGDEGDTGSDDSMQQFMQRFFGGPGGPGMDPGPRDQKQESLGSGVVVDKNGYILTNNHVVEKATRMKVKFNNDDTEYDAKLIGTDPLTDLAVIHINKTDLKAAKVGNSDAVQVGDWAVAIGSPFGFAATVTAGIISAKTRHLEDGPSSPYQGFLQTDAAINPGNSGGPLLNINGEVIGINTMIASRTGGYQGIGFAMPSNTAVKIYNEIIKTGYVTRGSIGISFRENPDTKELLKASGAKQGGVFVEKVEPEGPSAKAGLKAEDVIVSIDGKPVKNGQDLIDTVSTTPVGTTLKLGIVRDFASKTMEVAVGDRSKIFASTLGGEKSFDETAPGEPTQAKFGISIRNLTDGVRQNLGYKGKGGVLVDSVEQGSFADDIGLTKGDVIESMTANSQRMPINSVEDVKNIQNKLKSGDSVAFRIMRSPGAGRGDWQQSYLAGKLPATGQ